MAKDAPKSRRPRLEVGAAKTAQRSAAALLLLGSFYSGDVHADEPMLCAFPAEPIASLSAEAPLVEPGDAEMCLPLANGGIELETEDLRQVWAELDTLEPIQAVLRISSLEAAYPSLQDLFTLKRADLLMTAELPGEARRAYADAIESVDSEVRLRARVGRVFALIAMDHRDAYESLLDLGRAYPDLPDRPALDLALAGMRERQGRTREAISIYRELDIRFPGSALAVDARAALERLRNAGERVSPMRIAQRVERASRLVRRGPLDMAKTELEALAEEATLSGTHRAQVFYLRARIARHEGRWADARRLLRQGQSVGATVGDEEDEARRVEREAQLARAARADEREDARVRIQNLRRRRSIRRVNTNRLVSILRIAARAELGETADEAIRELVRRELPPGVRVDIAHHAAGSVNDEHLIALLTETADRPGQTGLSARYHLARAYERLGRLVDAEREFAAVRRQESGLVQYYGLWAEQGLRRLRADDDSGDEDRSGKPIGPRDAAPLNLPLEQNDAAPSEEAESEETRSDTSSERLETLEPEAPRPPVSEAILGDHPPVPLRPREPVNLDEVLSALEPLVEEHGEAYPWLERAQALLQLGEERAAGRQLYEAFLAYREASGRAIRRAGAESVARGADRPSSRVDFTTRRNRRRLDGDDREALADIAEMIGDYGASTGFGGWDRVQERPRAYEELVFRAAESQNLDPNLLFAIMRVESVYQQHIVSYAGAIGLCQIMPRTGQLIADAMGETDYRGDDLLDPETNLRFAAWYLRSLIDRFDGHLPLAIASYNGGPHNVRLWMRGLPRDMPLDAFLEHIPFEQTHRYVRRVLTHYEAYRAQQGLEMIDLSPELPTARVDSVGF